MAASYVVEPTRDPTASQLIVRVVAAGSPATTTAIFRVATSPALSHPAYLGVCTVAELETLPTADPGNGRPWRTATAIQNLQPDQFEEAEIGVLQAVSRLARAVDQQAAGRQVTTLTVTGQGWE